MIRGLAFELVPWENEPYTVEDKSLDMYHRHFIFITILIILYKCFLFLREVFSILLKEIIINQKV